MKLFLALSILGATIVFAACASSQMQTIEKNTKSETAMKEVTNDKRTPVIIELFTSEGCSSCPPADNNLRLIVETQPFAGVEVIGLSEHVDYWNRLGWTDPFSKAEFSARQGEYSDFFSKSGSVYTPQMIVDGTQEFVGANFRAAENAIVKAAKSQKASVEIEAVKNSDKIALSVKIENLPEKYKNAVVLLAVTEDNVSQSVPRGENAGRQLNHIAVTRQLIRLADAKNSQQSINVVHELNLSSDWKIENLNLVVFVQDTETRQIYGAAKTKI